MDVYKQLCSSSSYDIGGLAFLSSCCSPCGSLSMGSGGGSVSASSLGILAGANVGGVNQIPQSEILIQPPPIMIIFPGSILTSSFEPVLVGGYSAGGGGGSYGRYRSSGSGLLGRGRGFVYGNYY
ncbi:scale keratin-like [Tiliqua scincoides]|uniref:scale keratin-like n=1 Tax=Tiliqua scincoides TaxID=71010 RepID=UPI0034617E24